MTTSDLLHRFILREQLCGGRVTGRLDAPQFRQWFQSPGQRPKILRTVTNHFTWVLNRDHVDALGQSWHHATDDACRPAATVGMVILLLLDTCFLCVIMLFLLYSCHCVLRYTCILTEKVLESVFPTDSRLIECVLTCIAELRSCLST